MRDASILPVLICAASISNALIAFTSILPVVIAPSSIFVEVIAPSPILSDDKVPFNDTPSFSESEPIVNVPVILAAFTFKFFAVISSASNPPINASSVIKVAALIIFACIAPVCKKPTFSDFCQFSLLSPLPFLSPATPNPSLSLSS